MHAFKGDKNEATYRVYDAMRGEIATKVYKRTGEETIELAGKTFNTTVLEEFNQLLGITTKLWLEKENSFPVKIDAAGRIIYLADKSVKKQIQRWP